MATSPNPGTSGDEVGRRTFSTSFRGFDQGEVRAYLEVVAAEFAALHARVADLERELEQSTRPAAPPTLDVATLTGMVGEETARVLRAAQEAAEDLRTRAEEGAARTLTEAHEEAARVRSAAESVLAERTTEAERTAAAIRAEAQEKADKVTRDARTEADRVVHDAVEQGRDMVGQAQAARERVLGDLSRRRRTALAQVEQLREGRERLVASLANVRTELDRITLDLAAADEVARQAAEVASRSVRKEPSETEENGPEVAAGFAPGEPAGSGGPGIAEAGTPPPPGPEGAPAVEPPAEETPAEETPAAEAPTAAAPPVHVPTAETHVVGAPAAETPPVETPPVETPPVETPPVETPPVETPPVETRGAETPAGPPAARAPGLRAASPDPADVTTDALVAEEALISAPRKPGRRIKEPIPAPPGPARPSYAHDAVPAAVLPEAAVGTPEPDEPGEARRVDDVFARIRADRAVATDDARATLASDPSAVRTGPAQTAPAKSAPAKTAPAKTAPAKSAPSKVGPATSAGPDAEKTGPAGETSRPPRSAKRKRAATKHPAASGDDAAAGPGADRGLEAPRSDADETYLQRRDVLVEVVQSTTTRALRRCLADDQNAALDRFRTLRTDTVGVDALLGGEADQVLEWARRAASGLADGATAGGHLATGAAGSAPDPAVVTPIADRLATELVTALRSRLEMVLESVGKDRGPDTVDRINSVFREWRSRIDRAVGDAVTEAVSAGFAAVAPAGTPVTWVVEDLDGPCPDCDDNALAGAIALGELFPTGQAAPPAHPGCRCVLSRATT